MGGIKAERTEVLRYLGYRGQRIDSGLDLRIDTIIAECEAAVNPLYTHAIFALERRADGICLPGAGLLLPGRDIAALLCGARYAALSAATLGAGAERLLRRYTDTDMADAVIADAALSVCAEAAAELCSNEIAQKARTIGLFAGRRYSPGYGDLPLKTQAGLLRALDAGRRIGLTATEAFTLLPGKSVTAVTGLYDAPAHNARPGCSGCAMRDNCEYRKAGHCDGKLSQ